MPGSELESEESSSEFIFVCSNPNVLAVPVQIRGQHKVIINFSRLIWTSGELISKVKLYSRMSSYASS